MPTQPILTPRGLYTDANALTVPPGALLRAENVEISRDGILDTIRGTEAYVTLWQAELVDNVLSILLFDDVINRLEFFGNMLIAHRGTSQLSHVFLEGDHTLDFGEGGLANWGDYANPILPPDADNPLRFATAGGAKFFTSSVGVQKLGSSDPTHFSPATAGVPKGLDLTAALVTGTTIPANSSVAYRVVWCRKDPAGRLIVGAPGGRLVVSTAGAAKAVELKVLIPNDGGSADFFQLYRSATVANTIVPSDEMQMVYESTGLDAAPVVTVTDIVPESQRRAAGYFSPSQEGLLRSNERPPLARDIARWRDNLFFLNTTTKRRRLLTLIGTGSGSLVATDVITIAGDAYTAVTEATALVAGDANFRVYTTGTVSQNLENTARGLVAAINQRSVYVSVKRVYAYYASSETDAPGNILLEEIGVGGATDSDYALTASAHGSAWNPILPTSGSTVFVPAERRPGRLHWSKDGQYEAVPLGNAKDVGDADTEGYRLLPTRDSLIVLKKDGAYRVVGTGDANFRVEELDTTAVLLAPETAQVLNNQVFGLFTQGVCSLSDGGGLQVLSRPTEDAFLPLETTYPTRYRKAFAVAHEEARTYEIHIPTAEIEIGMGRAFRYNLFTRAWTNVSREKTCATVGDSPRRIYYGDAEGLTFREKRTFTDADYQEHSFPFPLDAAGSTGHTVATQGIQPDPYPDPALYPVEDLVAVGDYVVQGELSSRITAVGATSVTVADADLPWEDGYAEFARPPRATEVRFAPATQGDPVSLKQIQDILFFFRGALPSAFTAVYSTPFTPGEVSEVVDVDNQTSPGVLSAPPPAEMVTGPWLSFGFRHQVLHEKLSCLGAAVVARVFRESGGR